MKSQKVPQNIEYIVLPLKHSPLLHILQMKIAVLSEIDSLQTPFQRKESYGTLHPWAGICVHSTNVSMIYNRRLPILLASDNFSGQAVTYENSDQQW